MVFDSNRTDQSRTDTGPSGLENGGTEGAQVAPRSTINRRGVLQAATGVAAIGGAATIATRAKAARPDTWARREIWVDTPDEMADALQTLETSGGVVRARRNDVRDGDWTEPIAIPNNTSAKFFQLDLRNWDVELTEFEGPYIERPQNTDVSTPTNLLPLRLHGPRRFDVSGVDDPGKVMHLWDTGRGGNVVWPHCRGPVDAIVHKRQGTGSGHMTQYYVNGNGVERGVIIGDDGTANADGEPDPQNADRCFWWGQLGGIKTVGVEIRKGKNHKFWIQPESGGSGSVGYQDKFGNNVFYNNHAKTDVPFDIQAPYSAIDLGYAAGAVWRKSKVGCRPSNVGDSRSKHHNDPFQTDTLGQYDTAGASFDGPPGHVVLSAGGTDGMNPARIQHHHGLGRNVGVSFHDEVLPQDADGRVERMGLWRDASNYVIFEYDPSESSEWRALHVANGTEEVRTPTGVSFRSAQNYGFGDRHFLGIWFTQDRIVWYVREREVAATTGDFSGYDFWKYKPRHAVESTDGNAHESLVLDWETVHIGRRTHSLEAQ